MACLQCGQPTWSYVPICNDCAEVKQVLTIADIEELQEWQRRGCPEGVAGMPAMVGRLIKHFREESGR